MKKTQPLLLIILDGFGIGKDSPFNAIKNAEMPFYKKISKDYPFSEIVTHGEEVGLPHGVMGNSEVGHMTIGAGRVIYQDLVRINQSIKDKSFFSNTNLRQTILAGNGRVHLMGLLSDGGVHSHQEHLYALLELCAQMGLKQVFVHPFLDGRDTPPDSALKYVEQLLNHDSFQQSGASLASLSGRYWAMDRDQRWERTQKALDVLLGNQNVTKILPTEYLKQSYSKQTFDEFVEPAFFNSKGKIEKSDSIVFFNFRADRARQLTQKLSDWVGSEKLVTFTEYDSKSKNPIAYPSLEHKNIFGQWLEKENLKQFRIAETEKYAHVTFFFNGGREKPFRGEDRFLVPSPKDVPTYDLRPEMSAFAIAEEVSRQIESGKYDFILVNFANADMVGHTGNYDAALSAMEVLDQCLAKVVGTAEKKGFQTLITADHGNIEEMQDANGKPHTQHTTNTVPMVWIAPHSASGPKSERKALNDGSLADIIPTVCHLMKLPVADEMNGKNLLKSLS